MYQQLKEKLIAKIELAQAEIKAAEKAKVPLERGGRKTSFSGGAKRPQNTLFRRVKRKLLKERIWADVQNALAEMGFDLILRAVLRKQEAAANGAALSAARAKQLELFPGFEHLPVRIRAGNSFVKFPEMPVQKFIVYAVGYSMRAHRNQQRAEELERLAQAVKPIAADYPDMPMARAFDRAQAEPVKLEVVPKQAGRR